jgi:hypothetical protein
VGYSMDNYNRKHPHAIKLFHLVMVNNLLAHNPITDKIVNYLTDS